MENDYFINQLKEKLKEQEIYSKPLQDPFEGFSDEAIKLFKNVPAYKEAYEEAKVIRKVNAFHAQKFNQEKQSVYEIEADLRFPELRQPNSPFSIRVQLAMNKYGINKLAAAKLVKAEGE